MISFPDILHLAVETAATQTKPAYAGYRSLYFPLVRAFLTGNAIAPEFYSEDLAQDVSFRLPS
ncbi:hypothetical protein [Coleofasciculus sp. FACHB-129]|uniref:hypothetical protein n=1 Tax=Cyanophyceae TaxID=3028117 RepID=UPI0016833CDA|nr:hypothetical protein [Coleofasciculus sp. FACHB-129]MBD1894322.1 hypothetical protein [Coleofasciculus sp. FACHB-129]